MYGSRQCPSNYRPVSLTSIVIKIFESLIKDFMFNHLKTNKLISNMQYHDFLERLQSCMHGHTIHNNMIMNNDLCRCSCLMNICMQGSRNHGAKAPQHFNWEPCPCNVEAWQLLIKLTNDQLTHMTNKMCKFTILFIK